MPSMSGPPTESPKENIVPDTNGKKRAWQTKRTKERVKQLAKLTHGEPFYGSDVEPEYLGYDKKGSMHGFFSDRVKDGVLVAIRQDHFGWKKKPKVKAASPTQEGQPTESEPTTPPKNGKLTAEEIVALVRQDLSALSELAEQALYAKDYTRAKRLTTLLEQLAD